MTGPVLLPGSSGYATARLAYDPIFDGQRPAAIARCATPADVQLAVAFAAATGTRVAARCGGHSYAGYSTPDGGLMIDVGPLDSVAVDGSGLAAIGAGARLIDVYTGVAGSGRALPGGSCPTVGVTGLTLGGGIGVLARAFGLTCDRLVQAQIVTADGALRTVSAGSDPDLFWALRGGGGGNFGVVTALRMSTEPAPSVTTFTLSFPSGSVPGVLGAWQPFMAGAPDQLWTTCNVSATSRPRCTVSGCYVGSTSAVQSLLAPFVRASGATPSASYASRSYLDAMRHYAGCSELTAGQCQPDWTGPGSGQLVRESFVGSSRMLYSQVSDTQALVSAVAGSGGNVIFDSLGGAVGRVGPTATAFPHRSALASVQLYFGVGSAGAAAARTTMGRVRDALTGPLGNHAYVNYIDPAMPDWATACYGGNLTRLRQVAAGYDPHGVFRFAQGLAA